MFPELRERLNQRFERSENAPISLNLKAVGPIDSFDAVSVADIEWYRDNGYNRIHAILSGGLPAWSGETVNLQSALNHSVVWACNRIISESIGFLPAVLMQQRNGAKREASDHPMFGAMKWEPNAEITAQAMREMMTSHCVLGGNAFAQILRRSSNGTAIELRPIDPANVEPEREKTGQKRLVYVVKEQNQPDRSYPVTPGAPHDILHLRGLGYDGIRGYSVISMARQSLGTAIAAERNVARFWANGGRVPYLLKMAGKFRSDEEFQKFRKNWEATYAEPHKAPILENDIAYEKIGLSMADAQALETRQFTIPEICRWFSVSPHLVGDLSRATFSNIEHLALEFVKMTLATWITRWEQDFRRCVLTAEEKASGLFLKHNVNALLRGDFKTRMEGYASALQNGHLNVDEVRDLEDRNPLPDNAGQDYHIQLNMQTLPSTDAQEPQPSKPSGLVRLTGRGNNGA